MRKALVMHDEAFNKYLDEIPAEIRDAVSELSSPQRWAVFLAILREDRYFNELRRELGISAEQLDNILRRLVIGGLIYKEMASPAGIGDRKKSRYTITPSGKNLVRSLLEGFLPEAQSPAVRKPSAGYDLQKYDKLLVCETENKVSMNRRTDYPRIAKRAGSRSGKKPAPAT
jgi:DNA-binding HxlR family transcriptional regulator